MLTAAILSAVMTASVVHNIDSKLLLAIIEVESGYNPSAIGKSHGEIGLFQLRPEFHECASFDIVENVNCGANYLSEVRRIKGSEFPKAWWVYFNYGPYSKLERPRDTQYYEKVMEAMR